MKKIKSLLGIMAIVATVLTSCSKLPPADVNPTGAASQTFRYYPTNLTATLLSVSGENATVRISNGATINITAITPTNQGGQCFVLDAPIVPLQWDWESYSSRWVPSGFAYNSLCGFSNTICAAYYVEKSSYDGLYRLIKGAGWANNPNPGEYTASFTSPGAQSTMSYPRIGIITKGHMVAL